MTPNTLLSLAARYLTPLFLVLSIVILYRGHNLPGGGFIGGLVAAAALFIRGLAIGWGPCESRLPMRPEQFLALGLFLAIFSGLPAVALGHPPMTGLWLPDFSLPGLGKVHLGTPLLFDVGVYLTVIGFSLKSVFTFANSN